MRQKLMWMTGLIAIMAGAAGVQKVQATDPFNFIGTTIALGRFDDIEAANHMVREIAGKKHGHGKDLWLSLQKTKGPSDLYVQSNEIPPGGHSGWHTHPGHSLIIVTAGSITAYEGDDESCTPTVYTSAAVNGVANMGFVDPGGDHVHLLRNEGAITARTVAVQLIPAGLGRRVDKPAPGHCAF